MFLPVSELQLRNLDFDLKIAPGELNFLDDTLRQESDLVVQGTASLRPSTREILVRGFLSVDVSFPCDRCLERVRQRIEKELSLNYLPEELGPMEDEREIGEAEADIGFYSGGGIELDDLLRESVLLELPMRRVCQPACVAAPEKLLGTQAKESGQKPDSRWEALGGLRLQKSKTGKPGE
jgi:uncharacterized protein